MVDKIVEVVKAKYHEQLGYLFVTYNSLIFANLFPSVGQKTPSLKKTAAVGLLAGPLAAGAYHASKSVEIKDTVEKERLRNRLNEYRKTGNKRMLDYLSKEEIFRVDLEAESQSTSYSSISEVRLKEPRRFRKGKIVVTHHAEDTREFEILENSKCFSNVVANLRQLLPPSVFR